MSKRWQKQRVVNSLHCLKSDGIVRERISIRRRIEEREDVVELPRAMYSRMLKEGVNVVCRRVEESKKESQEEKGEIVCRVYHVGQVSQMSRDIWQLMRIEKQFPRRAGESRK